MKTLTDFKRALQSCKTNGIQIKSTVVNPKGEVIKSNDFAPVCHIQTNSFALLRNNTRSWAEFGKASQWQFDKGAKQSFQNGGYIYFEFDCPSFFGL